MYNSDPGGGDYDDSTTELIGKIAAVGLLGLVSYMAYFAKPLKDNKEYTAPEKTGIIRETLNDASKLETILKSDGKLVISPYSSKPFNVMPKMEAQ